MDYYEKILELRRIYEGHKEAFIDDNDYNLTKYVEEWEEQDKPYQKRR